MDIWRLLSPTAREFSYFSDVHKSDSRIDYFILDSKLLSQVVDCTYHNIFISDHAPVSLKLNPNLKQGILNDLWEVVKSVLRGHIISYEATEKIKSKARLSE